MIHDSGFVVITKLTVLRFLNLFDSLDIPLTDKRSSTINESLDISAHAKEFQLEKR